MSTAAAHSSSSISNASASIAPAAPALVEHGRDHLLHRCACPCCRRASTSRKSSTSSGVGSAQNRRRIWRATTRHTSVSSRRPRPGAGLVGDPLVEEAAHAVLDPGDGVPLGRLDVVVGAQHRAVGAVAEHRTAALEAALLDHLEVAEHGVEALGIAEVGDEALVAIRRPTGAARRRSSWRGRSRGSCRRSRSGRERARGTVGSTRPSRGRRRRSRRCRCRRRRAGRPAGSPVGGRDRAGRWPGARRAPRAARTAPPRRRR